MIDGFATTAFRPVARAFRRQLIRTGGGGGACVYYRGECVLDVWGGRREPEGRPWERDTLAPSFSTSKGVVSTALHILVDDGLLDYDDRVAEHWPEFAQNGKQDITLRHLLSHQAGLYNVRDLVDHAERLVDYGYMVEALAAAKPEHEPGRYSAYHALTYGYLVGEVVRRVTGSCISEVIQQRIAEPLGLEGLFIGTPEEELERAATLFWLSPRTQRKLFRLLDGIESLLGALKVAPRNVERVNKALLPPGVEQLDFNSPEVLTAVAPSFNGLFSARSLARMYAALAAGGTLDGVRILGPETIRRATEVQTRGLDRVFPFPMRWRLGYHLVGTTLGIPSEAFGHFGLGGSGGWACPVRNLAVAMVVNSGIGSPFGDLRLVELGAEAIRCARGVHRRRQRALAVTTA